MIVLYVLQKITKMKIIIEAILTFGLIATLSADEWKIAEKSIPTLFGPAMVSLGHEPTEEDYEKVRDIFRAYVYSIKQSEENLTLTIERSSYDDEVETYILTQERSGLLAGTKEGRKTPSVYLLPIEEEKMRFWWGTDPSKSIVLIPKPEQVGSGQRR